MSEPAGAVERLPLRRQFGKIDGVLIIETKHIVNVHGDTSETTDALLLEDGHTMYGCRKCDRVAASRSSIGSHQKKHAFEEGRARSQQGKVPPVALRQVVEGPARRRRDIEEIAAEIASVKRHYREMKVEMRAALEDDDDM